MKFDIKQKKGLSLISTIITIIVLLIIIGAISYSSINGFKLKKIKNFYSDIDTVADAVSVYYLKNEKLPIYYTSFNTNGTPGTYQPLYCDNVYFDIPANAYDDLTSYGIVDLSKLQNISLNNKQHIENYSKGINSDKNIKEALDSGRFYESRAHTSMLNDSVKQGIYIVNANSHVVYYTNPVEFEGTKYYSNIEAYNSNTGGSGNKYSKIPNFEKKEYVSQEDYIIKKGNTDVVIPENNVLIKFNANQGYSDQTGILAEKSEKVKDVLPKADIPTKVGYIFRGWAYVEPNNIPASFSTESEMNSWIKSLMNLNTPMKNVYYTSDNGMSYSIKNGASEIDLNSIVGNSIELYAIWQYNEAEILNWYYADSTGGILPTFTGDRKSLQREGRLEATKYPICVDIPGPGYMVEWRIPVSEDNDGTVVPIYYAKDRSGNVTHTNTKSDFYLYKTEGTARIYRAEISQRGTFEITGSVIDLNVKILDSSSTNVTTNKNLAQLKFSDTIIGKTVEFHHNDSSYKGNYSGLVARIVSSNGVTDVEWLTGANGKMVVPSNVNTYYTYGIKEPLYPVTGENKYANLSDENALFYLDGMVVTDGGSSVDYKNDYCELGAVVEVKNSNATMYPVFKGRNYMLTNSSNTKTGIYFESLEDAYNAALADGTYNSIKVLKNLDGNSTNNGPRAGTVFSDNSYLTYHDPTYSKVCNLYSPNSSGKKIEIHGENKKIFRITPLNLKGYADVDAAKFCVYSTTSEEGVGVYDNSKFKLEGDSIIENINQTAIKLAQNAKIYIIKADIKTKETNYGQNKNAIYSDSNRTEIYLGCESSTDCNLTGEPTKNSYIKIRSDSGYPINTSGKIYWHYGTLYTNQVERKGGYNPECENFITASIDGPCIEKDSNNDFVCTVDKRNWKWNDKDENNVERSFYAKKLAISLTCSNIRNRITALGINNNRKEITDAISEDPATINKTVTIDFYSPRYSSYGGRNIVEISSTSNYVIAAQNVVFANMRNKTLNSITVNSSKSLTLNDCDIDHQATGVFLNNNGNVDIDSYCEIYATSTAGRCNKLIINNENMNIYGRVNNYSSGKDKIAVDDYGYLNVDGYSATVGTLEISGTCYVKNTAWVDSENTAVKVKSPNAVFKAENNVLLRSRDGYGLYITYASLVDIKNINEIVGKTGIYIEYNSYAPVSFSNFRVSSNATIASGTYGYGIIADRNGMSTKTLSLSNVDVGSYSTVGTGILLTDNNLNYSSYASNRSGIDGFLHGISASDGYVNLNSTSIRTSRKAVTTVRGDIDINSSSIYSSGSSSDYSVTCDGNINIGDSTVSASGLNGVNVSGSGHKLDLSSSVISAKNAININSGYFSIYSYSRVNATGTAINISSNSLSSIYGGSRVSTTSNPAISASANDSSSSIRLRIANCSISSGNGTAINTSMGTEVYSSANISASGSYSYGILSSKYLDVSGSPSIYGGRSAIILSGGTAYLGSWGNPTNTNMYLSGGTYGVYVTSGVAYLYSGMISAPRPTSGNVIIPSGYQFSDSRPYVLEVIPPPPPPPEPEPEEPEEPEFDSDDL